MEPATTRNSHKRRPVQGTLILEPRVNARTPTKTRRHTGNNQHSNNRTIRQKVDHIAQEIRKCHLNFKTFVQLYISTEKDPEMSAQGETARTRASKMAELLSDPEFVRTIARHLDAGTWLGYIVKAVVDPELQALGTVPIFGRFDTEATEPQLDLSSVYQSIVQIAPNLADLLRSLLTPITSQTTSRQVKAKTAVLTSMIRRSQYPIKGNRLHTELGVYMQSQGVKRRVIATLAGMGICAYPRSIYRANRGLAATAEQDIRAFAADCNTHVCYDNFDYMERTSHHGHDSRDQLRHLTTAKLFKSIEVPYGGLDPAWLREDCKLQAHEITTAPGNQYDEIARAISLHEIAECVRRIYPDAIATIFGQDDNKVAWTSVPQYPQMPQIQRLAKQKTVHSTLKPIFENEGSIDGTHAVVEDIMDDQLGLRQKYDTRNEETADATTRPANDVSAIDATEILTTRTSDDDPYLDWDPSKRLKLVYGDQKTISGLRTMRKESRENDDAYDRRQWILPVPGLFHLKMCLIQAIEGNFEGPAGTTCKSTLRVHRQIMQRKICPSFQAPHSYTERLVIDSYHARILAFVYEDLCVRDDYYETVSDRLAEMDIPAFLQLLQRVQTQCFSSQARQIGDVYADIKKVKNLASAQRDATQLKSHIDGKEERVNHVRFIQIVETYRLLCYAIRYADIGLIRRVIDRCILIFHARSHKNYAFVMLWLKWLTNSSASDVRLQNAVLANGLVNLAGRPDSWFEIDRANEFLNCYLKTLLQTRRNGTFGLETQLETCTLLATYTGKLREVVEASFGEHTNTKHAIQKSTNEIHTVALICQNETLITQRVTPTTRAPFYVMDLLAVGLQNLLQETKKGGEEQSSRLERFNQNVLQRANQVHQPDVTMPDIPNQLGDPLEEESLGRFAASEISTTLLDQDEELLVPIDELAIHQVDEVA